MSLANRMVETPKIADTLAPVLINSSLIHTAMLSNETTLTIPLTISIRVGLAESGQQSLAADAPAADGLALEAARPTSYYDGYTGYDPDFLGESVPLPTLTDEQRRNAAKNSMAANGADPTVLPYINFSVVMNRRRQLAYYTVVNIDGDQSERPTRGKDRWFFDSRIAESEQIGEALYKRNALDRGHLVRRLDPVWGRQAVRANDDTFHFTNCSPQHERFNQNNETWQGLENFILDHADRQNKKVSVFTGPVVKNDDPLYKGVRLPMAFWKILVYIRENGGLGAAAFMLEQGDLIETLPGLEARFLPATFRVTLDVLKAATSLDFDYLKAIETPLTANRFEAATDGEGLETMAAGPDRVTVASNYANLIL
jgi:endonuclease G, mitochondrial